MTICNTTGSAQIHAENTEHDKSHQNPSPHTILKVICTGVGRVWEQDYLVPRPSYISNELTMVHCKYVML